MGHLIQGLPSDILSSDNQETRRVAVEQGGTAYDEAREFRLSQTFSVETTPVTYKFESTRDVDLTRLVITVDSDGVAAVARRGSTETASFTDTSPVVLTTNRKNSAPSVTSGVTVTTGGTIDDATGDYLGTIRVRSAGATAQRSSVTSEPTDQLGLCPCTFYIQLTRLGSGTAQGVLSLKWEETV
jgi:hypothetical protein